ncbi:unnamed protein product [Sphacelaria rigidula]
MGSSVSTGSAMEFEDEIIAGGTMSCHVQWDVDMSPPPARAVYLYSQCTVALLYATQKLGEYACSKWMGARLPRAYSRQLTYGPFSICWSVRMVCYGQMAF